MDLFSIVKDALLVRIRQYILLTGHVSAGWVSGVAQKSPSTYTLRWGLEQVGQLHLP